MDPFEPPRARSATLVPPDEGRLRRAATACLLGGVAVAAAGAQLLGAHPVPGPATAVGAVLAVAGIVQVVGARRLADRDVVGAWVTSVAAVFASSALLAWNAWSLRAGFLSPLALLAAAVETPAGALVVVAAPSARRRS
jgi:hypothetical protein